MPAGAKPAAVKPAAQAKASPAAKPQFGLPPQATGRAKEWKKQLAAVDADAMACRKCALCETRTKVVFGTGEATVPLVFVGEAPGRDEDLQGVAFVGRAGQLLTKIIEAMGLRREDVYICNVLKCRPPNNRDPQPEEVVACIPYLERQLEILKPRIICSLGRHSTYALLNRKDPIGKLRGRVFLYNGIKMVPTYHPAALLRNPDLKRTVWEDVQKVRRILDDPDSIPAEAFEEVEPFRMKAELKRRLDQDLGI
ncbi:MAG: uracil-DNA glycosylase [Candidatus Eisenbacteria bacterium]|uniref:Type-4 uracil-DNA glycosylase n=1 Tax=Eiseniibacteriota bacterium TaxID=2212470 RepID=A0A948S0M2_UNCEI|nr:uracil-DNA glycosylase [Candidatus Eisenbacteria bacterium]MBU1948315.1 uracil-DNA glycosylase [Candidatus Eisenbacteria bacterium]MBU2693107.1 uracil-DNA glycosylase [Candidatus Eisenbacteria bacterium]